MKAFKRLISLALIFFILISMVSGCGESSLSTNENRLKIKVIVKKKDADFFSVVKMGSETAGKEFNIDVQYDGPENEKDIENQIKMVDQAISDQFNAIVLAAADYNKLAPVVEKAANQNIPVIIIDSQLNSDRIKSFIGTDNQDAGIKLGNTLVKRIGTKCRIAVMNFMKGAASSDQREKGIYQVLEKYPQINVVSNMYCNSDEEIAYQLIKKVVKENPDIDAILCTNAYGAVGTARAIESENLSGKIRIIGLDSTPEQVDFLENGVIEALVIQNPFNMGYLGVRYALDSIYNKPVLESYNTGLTIIDKDNMYLPENEKLVFPFSE